MPLMLHRAGWRSLSLLGGLVGLSVFVSLPTLAQITPEPNQPPTDTPATPSPDAPSPNTPATPPAPDTPSPSPSISPAPNIPPSTNSPSPSPTPGAATTQNQSLSQLLQEVSRQGSFTTLAQLVQTAGLTNELQSQGGRYTIFAPTDAAFAALPQGALERLQRPENRALLRRILAYHVVPQSLPSGELRTGGLQTLGGGIAIRLAGGRVIVNDGSVVQPDIRANNGVVHAINRVLIPTGLRQQLISQQ